MQPGGSQGPEGSGTRLSSDPLYSIRVNAAILAQEDPR